MAHNNHDRSQPGRQSSREEGDDEDNELMMTRRRGGMIHEGTEAVIKCQIRANPPATSIHWFFNQRPISSDFPLPVPGITFSNNSTNLTIRSVSRRHEGMYKCSAVNIGGTGESPDFKVTVLCKYSFLLRFHSPSLLLPSDSLHSTISFFFLFLNTITPSNRSVFMFIPSFFFSSNFETFFYRKSSPNNFAR